MVRGIWTSGAALRPAMLAQSILANNLANANTAGFHQDRIAFERLASATSGEPPAGAAPRLAARLDRSAGPYDVTDRPLDLALQGDGYFVVETPEGPRYTRAGRFGLAEDGTLVTSQGHPVLTTGGPVALAGDARLRVTADGELRDGEQLYGRLRIVHFDPAARDGLTHAGGGLLASAAEPQEASGVQVLQGVLEGPNLQPFQTLGEMTALLRHFEMNQRALRAQDESLGSLLAWVRA